MDQVVLYIGGWTYSLDGAEETDVAAAPVAALDAGNTDALLVCVVL